MQEHERRIIGRVVDEIDRHRDGSLSMAQMLNRSWGLFEAAELRNVDDRDRFLDVYHALSRVDDAYQPWMPSGLGSDQDVQKAVVAFEKYARAIRDEDGAEGDVQ